MTLTDQLYCIVACIFENSGGIGGLVPLDTAYRRALEMNQLSREDRERLLNATIGYFYTSSGQPFEPVKRELWEGIAESIRGDGSAMPEWFSADTSITSIVCFAD